MLYWCKYLSYSPPQHLDYMVTAGARCSHWISGGKLDGIISHLRGSFLDKQTDFFFSFKNQDYWGEKKNKLDKARIRWDWFLLFCWGLCGPILQLWWWGNLSYVQGSLVAPFTVCLPLCLVSSFLFRSRLRVAPFFCLPSGCCRNTKSLCDWLMPGSFCWCRRRKKSLALFLRIPPARGAHRSGQGCGRMNPGQGGSKVPRHLYNLWQNQALPSRNGHRPQRQTR